MPGVFLRYTSSTFCGMRYLSHCCSETAVHSLGYNIFVALIFFCNYYLKAYNYIVNASHMHLIASKQIMIKLSQQIWKLKLNKIVIASCTLKLPSMHCKWKLFAITTVITTNLFHSIEYRYKNICILFRLFKKHLNTT